MSRVGKDPIVLPSGVEVTINDECITVKGPLGIISRKVNHLIKVINESGTLTFEPVEVSPQAHAMWGTMRALVNNMVKGVTEGFERKLQLIGVGYKAQVQGDILTLALGFSHPIIYQSPEGIKVSVDGQIVTVWGKDKEGVGQVASVIRGKRPPEPYKGKGVRYVGEKVMLKEIKKK